MNRNEITVNFADLSDQADQYNRSNPGRRFFPMTQYRGGRLHEFGMYDGIRKKYVLSEVNSRDAVARLAEIKNMLRSA